jgi:hypothetical protein
MTNEIPSAPRLLEGWWSINGIRCHILRTNPSQPFMLSSLCGLLLHKDLVRESLVGPEDDCCRRCLRSLPKWEAK